jgi:hypothetical protein
MKQSVVHTLIRSAALKMHVEGISISLALKSGRISLELLEHIVWWLYIALRSNGHG